MCLLSILPEDKQKKILDDFTDYEDIAVYKVAYNPYRDIYVSPYCCGIRRTGYHGTMEAEITAIRTSDGDEYQSGFHFFLDREAAVRLQESIAASRDDYVVMTAFIQKEWITTIGKEHGSGIAHSGKEIVIVAKKAIFNLPKTI